MNISGFIQPDSDRTLIQKQHLSVIIPAGSGHAVTLISPRGSMKPLRLNTLGDRLETAVTLDQDGEYVLELREASGGRLIDRRVIRVLPSWTVSAVVYNLFLRTSAQSSYDATLEDVLRHIDKVADAGVNVLYINPFYDTGAYLKKHNLLGSMPDQALKGTPYAVRDMTELNVAAVASDPALSSSWQAEEVLRTFVSAAHNRGIRVIFDLILNHTSHDFLLQRYYPEWFYYKEDILSTDSPYLYFTDGKPWGDPAHTAVPFEDGDFYWSDTAKLNWEFDAPPAPNDPPGNPSIRQMYEYFITVASYWVREFGIDGYRCDLAHRIPLSFWRECIAAVKSTARESHPHNDSIDGTVVFVAEAPPESVSSLLAAGFDFCYSGLAQGIDNPGAYLKSLSESRERLHSFNFAEAYDFHARNRAPEPVHGGGPDRSGIWQWALTATLPGMALLYSGFEKMSWHGIPGADLGLIGDNEYLAAVRTVSEIRTKEKALHSEAVQYLEVSGEDAEAITAYSRYNDGETLFVVLNTGKTAVTNAIVRLSSPDLDSGQPFMLKDLMTGRIYLRTDPEVVLLLDPGQVHIFKLEQKWEDSSYSQA
ncbi:MAG: Cyclomaltodextrinase [candidate division WS6 bacterium OLB20]|uniref:Cyclomaltodextrinase n=1 Tax=candidate division WS6 bacterium OLB20 TaxID=1617426 RepID=A0A136M022_9BACT|nr:MAG: Cyclomaltodextrinase [candidate division WS6 bacterium OLB20]